MSSIYEQILLYPFSSDPEFQAGLQAILAGAPQSAEEIETRTLQAQCFYISRKNNMPSIDLDAYREWLRGPQITAVTPALSSHFNNHEERSPATYPAAPAAGEPRAPHPRSFSHLVELITTGQPIPGIKEVPNTLLTGQESQPVTPKRKKPWEVKGEITVNGPS